MKLLNVIQHNRTAALLAASWVYAAGAAITGAMGKEKTAAACFGLSMVSHYAALQSDRNDLSKQMDNNAKAVDGLAARFKAQHEANMTKHS